MRKRLAITLAVIGLIGIPVGAASASPSGTSGGPSAVAAKTCSGSYTYAIIGGAEKCLRRGEYCATRYRSTYRRYGFTCSGSPARLR